MKGKHFRHENAGEAVYDADKHKSADDGTESLIITLVCVCVCEGRLCVNMCVHEYLAI